MSTFFFDLKPLITRKPSGNQADCECVICGKPVKAPKIALAITEDRRCVSDLEHDSVWDVVIVGNDCAKSIPVLFHHQYKQ